MNRYGYPELAELEPLIRGKRVAIVGNAASIFDKQLGDDINNHDFVIRFNRGYISRPECQGTKTDLLILACPVLECEAKSYKPKYIANRSKSYRNSFADFTINSVERANIKNIIGSQPSSGFMAINICLYFKAGHIDLYGFAGNSQPTFYREDGFETQHNYDYEQGMIHLLELAGLVNIY